MNSSPNFAIKNFLNRAILLGVISSAVALSYVYFLPKEYLVVGKVVVFPSSSAVQKNLAPEVGNTVQILENSAFQLNTFQGTMRNFAYAKSAKDSSTIRVAFYAQKDEEVAAQDAIVRVPAALAEYTRDLYDGNPFKYKLMGDPEVSVNSVRPNLAAYLSGGFAIGFLLSIIYWFLFEFLRVPMTEQMEKKEIAAVEEKEKENRTTESPKVKKAGKGTIALENGRPVFKPSKVIEPIGQPRSSSTVSAVPENLPIAGDDIEETFVVEEPSDEEVKERLNKLMRGEL